MVVMYCGSMRLAPITLIMLVKNSVLISLIDLTVLHLVKTGYLHIYLKLRAS